MNPENQESYFDRLSNQEKMETLEAERRGEQKAFERMYKEGLITEEHRKSYEEAMNWYDTELKNLKQQKEK